MRRGLVALGDSITNGRTEPMLGVHPQSWAQWTAEALGLPFTKLARDGAQAADVLAGQVPALAGPYDLGCLYVGVNDARSTAWDAGAFARDAERIVAALAAACERVLVLTLPEDLGRPTAAPKPAAANRVLREIAGRHGALVCDLRDFGGPDLVLPDAVHPTALGQVEIARRALAACGLPAARDLDDLVDAHALGPLGRPRWRARRGVLLAQDLRRRAVERVRARGGDRI